MDRINVRVASRVDQTPSIASFVLEAVDGSALPPFTAGAHVDVVTPGGALRQYSLCGDPADRRHYEIAVLNEPNSRGGSRSMFAQVQVGDVLSIGTPRNLFPLQSLTDRTLLLAGGIGITPLLAMAHTLHREGAEFDLHYWTRSSSLCAFLRTLAEAPFASNVVLHHDDTFSDAEQRSASVRAALESPGKQGYVYVCGPEGFMAHALETASLVGWADEKVRREHFSQPAIGTARLTEDCAFEVVVASRGEAYTVRPGQSIAAVLIENGVDLIMSCEQGICGTCVTGVLAGTPDHRDQYLSDEDRQRGDCILPCCSRAHGARIVLDL